MVLSPKHQRKFLFKLVCLLLLVATFLAPMVSSLAEQHELQHSASVNTHFSVSENHGSHQNSYLKNDSVESAMHFLAHASHCCGHIAALLPYTLKFIPPAVTTVLYPNIKFSQINFLGIPLFRPPINF